MAERSRESRSAERSAQRRAAFGRALRWAGRLGLAVLAGLLVWGSIEVRARVQSAPRFDLANWRFELGELPAWAPEEMRAEIASLRIGSGPDGSLSVFTPRVLDRIKAELRACPWIREVTSLRLRYPPGPVVSPPEGARTVLDPGNGTDAGAAEEKVHGLVEAGGGIDLELELRVPIASVAAGGAFYLADREGVRLGPGLGPERAKALRLPAIIGGEGRGLRRPPPPGLAWEDRDVREGLSVARILADALLSPEGAAASSPLGAIETIDVTNVAERARRGECEIVLSAGRLRLGWGRSPISPGARTLSPREILANLRRVLAHPPELSEGQIVLLYTSPLVLAGPSRRD